MSLDVTNYEGVDFTMAGVTESSIADKFLETATYAVGDVVFYNGDLYICHTAVSSAGSWTGSTNWTATTVEELINARQKTLPTTTTAGQVLKSTSTAGAVEWGAIPSGAQITKLWEHQSPDADMGETTVELSSADYDYLLITARVELGTDDTWGRRAYDTLVAKKGRGAYFSRSRAGYYLNPNDSIFIDSRAMNYVDDTHIQFRAGTVKTMYNNALVRTQTYSVLIPLVIMGVKL